MKYYTNRFNDETKHKIIQINHILIQKKLPPELRKIIIQNSFNLEKLAYECNNKREVQFIDICQIYKETICKEVLLYYGFHNIKNNNYTYCHILEYISKLVEPNNLKNNIYRIDDFIDESFNSTFFNLIFKDNKENFEKYILENFIMSLSSYCYTIASCNSWKNLSNNSKYFISLNVINKSIEILNYNKANLDSILLPFKFILKNVDYEVINLLLSFPSNFKIIVLKKIIFSRKLENNINQDDICKYVLEKLIINNDLNLFMDIISFYSKIKNIHISKIKDFPYLLSLIYYYKRIDFEDYLKKNHILLKKDILKAKEKFLQLL